MTEDLLIETKCGKIFGASISREQLFLDIDDPLGVFLDRNEVETLRDYLNTHLEGRK